MIVGIDLGTTHSAVAYLGSGGPTLINSALGRPLTPSVVGLDPDGHVLVGEAARELQVTHPERCAAVFKRHMGTESTYELAGKKFTPVELSSLVLQSLKADAEAHLKEPVTDAVITVPAYFNDDQRKATLGAGKLAGLNVRRIINEPTAAVIAYGFHAMDQEQTVLVIDLGGGTFDVSLAEIFEGVVEIRASAGINFLGGEDFTCRMAARILENRGLNFERAEHEKPLMVARLVRSCEAAKRALSREPSATVRIPDDQGNLSDASEAVVVKREEFAAWTEDLLRRMEQPVRRCLGDANVQRAEIRDVVLVGGATRMPAVGDLVRTIFQSEPRQRFDPDLVVAMGAAVQAGLLEKNASVDDLVVTDVMPFTLGVEVVKHMGGEMKEGYFTAIINRNTAVPVSRVERYATVAPNQRQVVVKVYQGESRHVKENFFLGEFTVKGIPPGPAGRPIDLRFTYDLNGILEVEATIVETQAKASMIITSHAKHMTPDELKLALKAMAKLKVHPREESVFRYLLRRAERVYKECNVQEKAALDACLDSFEAALESQDKAQAASWAEELRRLLDELRPESWSNEADERDGQQ